jgi:type I restriction-modification system DNA methylase subunit
MRVAFDQAHCTVRVLIDAFEKHRDAYTESRYSEAATRKDFIDPLLKALGWDVDHEREKNPYEQEVKVERTVAVQDSQKKADYAFHLKPEFHVVRFFLEAKKPSVNIDQHAEANFQILRYGWSAGTPLAVLSNFASTRVLDCRRRPDPATALNQVYRSWHYTAWREVDAFADFYWLFSREAHADGSYERRLSELPATKAGPKQRKLFSGAYLTVDESFLGEIERYRSSIAKALKRADLSLGSADLTEMSQRTVDRLVFMRFLEDKNIETDFTTRKIGQSIKGAWADFRSISHKLDNQYNGIIFKKHPLLDREAMQPADEVLDDIVEDLDVTNSPYHFDAIPIHILGSIYERFLGSVIHATEKLAKVEQKPEVRKAGGVYYTPEYIVRHITSTTVGRMIADKTPNEIAELRFADIACGSGSFLLGVYDELLRYHTFWYNSPRGAKQARRDGCILTDDGRWRLSLPQRRSILINNIYGVDIDRQAVEVAQLSLFLKLLEGEGAFSTKQYRLEFARDSSLKKVLPDLSTNIVCGNSVVGWDTAAFLGLSPADEVDLNPLDFNRVFPTVIKGGGFDAIIGNPPYLNIDDSWGRKSYKLAAIKSRYPHIHNDKTDLLYYFIARAIELSRGDVTLIVSRAFLEAYKADKLRRYILDHCQVSEVIDFRNAQIFKGVGITTCILHLKVKRKGGNIDVYRRLVDAAATGALESELSDAAFFSHAEVPQSTLDADSWSLEASGVRNLYNKIDTVGTPLGNILLIGQGMQTGQNDVFGLRSAEEIKSWQVPTGMWFLRATNSDIQAYAITNRGEHILFPNAVENFDDLPLGVRKFLHSHEKALKGRAAYKRGDCEWWQFTWPLHADHYDKVRIICPYLAETNRFAIDAQKQFLSLTDTTVLFDSGQRENMWYLLALLNSKLLTFRFRGLGKLKSKNIYEYFWNSVSKIPIRRIDLDDPAEAMVHEMLSDLAKRIATALTEAIQTRSTADLERLERKAGALRQDVDAAVYSLYGLSPDEASLVDSSVED